MTPQQTGISVIEPISPAIDKVKLILFKPFDFGNWFIIGFCAWLANLGKGAGAPNFNFSYGRRRPDIQLDQFFQRAKDYITDNLPWIIMVGLILGVLLIILWLVLTWLSSRGRFMFLHCVAANRAEVKSPWNKFAKHANSLFLFRIVLGLIGFVVNGLLCLIAIFIFFTLRAGTGLTFALIPGVILIFLSIFVLAIAFLLAHKFTTDFVVPIMFLRTASCMAGWREFWTLLSTNKGRFALYILFHIVIGLAIGAIVLVVVLMTCCCAGVILAIPYIGTVLMLPLLVFVRSYSLCYFRQFGPQFDAFSPEIVEPDLRQGP